MNFWTLFGFEVKKLFRRKLVWLCLAAMIAMSLVQGFLSNNSSSHSFNGIEISGEEYQRMTRKAEEALAGRVIDDTLLHEVQKIVTELDNFELNTYTDIETMLSYQGHLDIYSWIRQIFDEVPKNLTAEQVYEQRTAFQRYWWDESALTKGEQVWLKQQDQSVNTPIVYERSRNWENISGIIFSLNLMGILVLGICLPGIFSEEHSRRTDQLNLAAPLGRKLYSAKLLLGTLFGFVSFLVYWICGVIPAILAQGTAGFYGAIQLILPDYALAMTIGEMIIVLTGLFLISSIISSVFVMVMAEILHSGIATTAVVIALVLAVDMIPIPYTVRWLEEIISYLPNQLLSLAEAFDSRLFPWFGTYLTPWQAAPILWLAAGALLVLVGRRVYSNYQISGR